MILSTGMASEGEIEEAVIAARDAGCNDIVLLHCISSYPASVHQFNLRQIPELTRRFGTLSGLSDHSLGPAVSIAAVALGACLIEKHFTLRRSDKGPDSEFSLEPEEFEKLCSGVKDAWAAIGKVTFERKTEEMKSLIFRRSLYFVNDLSAGAVVGVGDVRRIRPGMGLHPKFYNAVVGRRLKVSVSRGQAVEWSVLS
jgi:N-acetylneuraminate synthase